MHLEMVSMLLRPLPQFRTPRPLAAASHIVRPLAVGPPPIAGRASSSPRPLAAGTSLSRSPFEPPQRETVDRSLPPPQIVRTLTARPSPTGRPGPSNLKQRSPIG